MSFGFLKIYKQTGFTSFDVIGKLRKSLGIRKIGHSGTLDPLASGLMIVAYGSSTKYLEYLLHRNKTYQATVRFGGISDTYDSDGVIEYKTVDVIPTREQIEKVVNSYLGESLQIPPQYSALKVQGKKACDLARKGIHVEIKPRPITIFSCKILSYTWPDLVLDIQVSGGTYIRSIAYDIGNDLGVGGYITSLKRTHIDNIDLENSIAHENILQMTSEEILQQSLVDQTLFSKFPSYCFSQEEYKNICHGKHISLDQKDTEICAGYYKDKLVCMGKIIDAFYIPRKVISEGI
jgi:tRNA pseudouridine55 synthase